MQLQLLWQGDGEGALWSIMDNTVIKLNNEIMDSILLLPVLLISSQGKAYLALVLA